MSRWAVLSGGGSKGAFSLGVVSKLKEIEPNLEYDGFAGISVGAMLAGTFVQGPLSETIPLAKKLWFQDIKGDSSVWKHKLLKYIILVGVLVLFLLGGTLTSFFLSAPMWLTSVLGVLWLASFGLFYVVLKNVKSIYDIGPLKKLVYKNYDAQKANSSGKKMIVGAVSWKTGVYETANKHTPKIQDWILGSSAFPLFLDNIKIGDKWYTDGGVRDTLPLKDAIAAGATEIDVFLATPLFISDMEALPPLIPQLFRTLEIMSNEILRNDLIAIGKLHPEVKIRIFMPQGPLMGDPLSFDPKGLRYMFEEGEKVALHPMTLQEVNAAISGR